VISPGLAFACAITSSTVFAGLFGGTTSTLERAATAATWSKSASGS
jgi:hypothetical protein